MNITDVISLSFRTVRSNKLRTGLTVSIIAFGIMALIGIITAIEAMNQKLTESFSSMGASGFTIRHKERNIKFNNNNDVQLSKKGSKKEKISNQGKKITDDEAEQFIRHYRFPAISGISILATREATITYNSFKTTPNITVFGGDENYILLNGLQIQMGRNFSRQEVHSGANVCLLGYDVANKLFKNRLSKAVNSIVRINGIQYRVIGVLESRGATFGFSRDNVVITTYTNTKRNFSASGSYLIGIMANNLNKVEEAMGEAEGTFRSIRKMTTKEESNFIIDRSNSVAEKAMNSLQFLTVSVTVIGLITLIGAAVGLMNIMLVSVTERTKEIGLIKAIGGKRNSVMIQFLSEAIIISIIGSLFGIFLGILVGNLFSIILGTGFVIPWNWVVYGIIICTIVGLAAGIYPAFKAGKLNPIDALRYE